MKRHLRVVAVFIIVLIAASAAQAQNCIFRVQDIFPDQCACVSGQQYTDCDEVWTNEGSYWHMECYGIGWEYCI